MPPGGEVAPLARLPRATRPLDRRPARGKRLRISDLLDRKRTLLSFEFFPPKSHESEHLLDETVEALRRFSPDYVSITYGAGGSTREKTLDWTLRMRDLHGQNPMMHLTCIASSRADMDGMVERLKAEGVENILSLRGDPPKDFPEHLIQRDFEYAWQLVEYLHRADGFCQGVAGYPEGHPEAPSLARDVQFLKRKIEAGAGFVITQLFFDNRFFYDFRERLARTGMDVPVIAGIMPIVNIGQVQRFTSMCGATVPADLVRRMEGKDEADMLAIGVEHAVAQCQALLDYGVDGLHFYTLNRNRATELILQAIGGRLERDHRDG